MQVIHSPIGSSRGQKRARVDSDGKSCDSFLTFALITFAYRDYQPPRLGPVWEPFSQSKQRDLGHNQSHLSYLGCFRHFSLGMLRGYGLGMLRGYGSQFLKTIKICPSVCNARRGRQFESQTYIVLLFSNLTLRSSCLRLWSRRSAIFIVYNPCVFELLVWVFTFFSGRN